MSSSSVGIPGTEWLSGAGVLQEKPVALEVTLMCFRFCFIPVGSLNY